MSLLKLIYNGLVGEGVRHLQYDEPFDELILDPLDIRRSTKIIRMFENKIIVCEKAYLSSDIYNPNSIP